MKKHKINKEHGTYKRRFCFFHLNNRRIIQALNSNINTLNIQNIIHG